MTELRAIMDRPQVGALCPASSLLGHSSALHQLQTQPIARAWAGAADGAALPAGGQEAKKNLTFMGMCHVLVGREELGGRRAFVLGSGCRVMSGRAGRCPTRGIWGSFAPASHLQCPGGAAAPPTLLVRAELRLEGMIPQLLRAGPPNML